MVHKVELRENTDRSLAHGVYMSGKLQSLRIDEIDVCGRDRENDTVGLRDIFGNEVACLLLNIRRLVANGNLRLLLAPAVAMGVSTTHLCQSRQINQGQAQDVWRVDLEVDGLSVDALVVSCYPGCLGLDLASNLGEVVESPSRMVEKLAPFLLACNAGGCVWDMNLVIFRLVFALARQVDELQDQRSPRDDAASSRQKVSTYNVFENGRLSGGLRSYNDLCVSVRKFDMRTRMCIIPLLRRQGRGKHTI